MTASLGLTRRALGYLWPHRARFAGGVGLTLVGIALDLVKPLPLALVLDVVLGDEPAPRWLASSFAGGTDLRLLSTAAVAIVLVTFGRGAANLAANRLTIDTGQRMVNDLRTALYSHLQKLSLKFHHGQQTGDLLYRVMSDTYSAQGLVMNGLLPLFSSAAMLCHSSGPPAAFARRSSSGRVETSRSYRTSSPPANRTRRFRTSTLTARCPVARRPPPRTARPRR